MLACNVSEEPTREQLEKFLKYFEGVEFAAVIHGMVVGSGSDEDLIAVREWLVQKVDGVVDVKAV